MAGDDPRERTPATTADEVVDEPNSTAGEVVPGAATMADEVMAEPASRVDEVATDAVSTADEVEWLSLRWRGRADRRRWSKAFSLVV